VRRARGDRLHEEEAQDIHRTSPEEDDLIPTLDVGTRICVRNRFLGDWTTGFLVAEVHTSGYRIRRLSDGHAFPDVFPFDDVRLERRQQPLRGISGSYLDRRH